MKVAHRVSIDTLPEVTKRCNYQEAFFKSEVSGIYLIAGTTSQFIVVLDVQGSYPYIENQWKELFEDEN